MCFFAEESSVIGLIICRCSSAQRDRHVARRTRHGLAAASASSTAQILRMRGGIRISQPSRN